MTAALCAIVLCWFQGPAVAADPASLVARLGSTKYLERQAASDELERLGRLALPALRDAQDSNDLEVKTRANGLIRKIESALLTQPSRISLNFKDTPISDVIKGIGEQSGMKIQVYPDGLPRWKSERIDLQSNETVPFWAAVDRLCAAAKLRHNPTMISTPGNREPTITLVAGDPQVVYPISDDGPFRVSLIRLHYERDVTFGSSPPPLPRPVDGRPTVPDVSRSGSNVTSSVSTQFNAQIQVVAEPRLSISQNGMVQIEEASDDQGNSLTNAPGGPVLTNTNSFRRPVMPPGQLTQLVIPLRHPRNPGSVIKILKGVVPIQVASRRGNPLVVPLENSNGKSFQNAEASVTVHNLSKSVNNRMSTLDVTIRFTGPTERIDGAEEPVNLGNRMDLSQMQVEVLDSQGRSLPWFQSSADPDSTRISMTLNQFGQPVQPKELRVYGLTRAEVKVPFSFQDITMP